jgi:hypothetical protein
MKITGGARKIVRFDVGDPVDLRVLTVSGAIWSTPYSQLAFNAIQRGEIQLSECRDVPPHIRAALTPKADG